MRPGDVLFQLRKAPIAEAGRRLKMSPEDIGHWQAMETCGFLHHFSGSLGSPFDFHFSTSTEPTAKTMIALAGGMMPALYLIPIKPFPVLFEVSPFESRYQIQYN